MTSVNLEDREWQQVMTMVANAPWHEANPLLMKIGEQLRRQANGGSPPVEKPEKRNEAPKASRP
jgi:hypothetical protein